MAAQKQVRPARTYIQQLCEDTGCCPEDLPRAMNDREEWRERVRDIRAAEHDMMMMMMNIAIAAKLEKGKPVVDLEKDRLHKADPAQDMPHE